MERRPHGSQTRRGRPARKAIRAQGLRFLTAFHHAEHWWFFPHWEPAYDTADPRYAGLYGPPHDLSGPQGSGFFDQSRPSQITKSGPFNEENVPAFTGQDVRFTVKCSGLYAICLGWPGERITIRSLKALWPAEIRSAKMLGVDQELPWTLDESGLTVTAPPVRPCEQAYTFKIERGNVFGKNG